MGSVQPILVCAWVSQLSPQGWYSADILDLSLGGASLLLQEWPLALVPGDPVDLDVSSHPDFNKAIIHASLRWLDPVKSLFQPCGLIGVQFHEPLARLPQLLSC